MTWGEVRKAFVEDSGHYELITGWEGEAAVNSLWLLPVEIQNAILELTGFTIAQVVAYVELHCPDVPNDWKDAGADRFIQSGQNWLDRQLGFTAPQSVYEAILQAGQYSLELTDFRYVDRMDIEYDGGIYKLNMVDLDDLTERFGVPPVIDGEGYVGEPLAYTPNGKPYVFSIAPYGDGDNRLVVVMPPPDRPVRVRFYGGQYTQQPSDDSHETWWTAIHPETLILAARMRLALARHRSAQETEDYRKAIEKDLNQIRRDKAQEEINAADDAQYAPTGGISNTWPGPSTGRLRSGILRPKTG